MKHLASNLHQYLKQLVLLKLQAPLIQQLVPLELQPNHTQHMRLKQRLLACIVLLLLLAHLINLLLHPILSPPRLLLRLHYLLLLVRLCLLQNPLP
jgi:hypothetical protein